VRCAGSCGENRTTSFGFLLLFGHRQSNSSEQHGPLADSVSYKQLKRQIRVKISRIYRLEGATAIRRRARLPSRSTPLTRPATCCQSHNPAVRPCFRSSDFATPSPVDRNTALHCAVSLLLHRHLCASRNSLSCRRCIRWTVLPSTSPTRASHRDYWVPDTNSGGWLVPGWRTRTH
jgi:hypothetical protein